ncbi:STAS domain-containing protein [Bacillus sp. 1P06AnD]|uniref:STAS domain-containing protein n=1 Tax=Bacillus sp. 1P06AnD TaxID=3132208 RepID=UPI00399FF446
MDNSKKLHDYLLEHADEMTNEWLEIRLYGNTAYSAKTSSEYKNLIREQNNLFIEILTKSLLEEQDYMEWANMVSSERAKSHSALHTSLVNFRKFRTIYWRHVVDFSNKNAISARQLGQWGLHINEIIDHIIELFSINYENENQKLLNAQHKTITELSSPVIMINERIGILPLIGEIDDYRANIIKENTLARCTRFQTEELIIDLSGVPYMDTMVANEIYQLTDMLSLIGVKAIITGISPEIAQTSVQLGLHFKNIAIYSTLQQALPTLPGKQSGNETALLNFRDMKR